MTRIDASLLQDGRERTWHAEVPDTRGPLPLVVVLHGAGSEGPRYLDLQGWGELARCEGRCRTGQRPLSCFRHFIRERTQWGRRARSSDRTAEEGS